MELFTHKKNIIEKFLIYCKNLLELINQILRLVIQIQKFSKN